MCGQRISTAAGGDSKACGVEDHVRRAQPLIQQFNRGAVLEACDVEGAGADAARMQRAGQSIDRGRLCTFKNRAVEDDGGERLALNGGVAIKAGFWQFARRRRSLRALEKMPAIGEEGLRILGSTRDEIVPQALAVVGGKRRAARQVRVGLCVTGQHAEQDAAFACCIRDLIEPIAPVGCATEDAEHDELRMGQGLLDIEIN